MKYDIIALLGAALLAIGAGMFDIPFGLIVGGLMLLLIAIIGASVDKGKQGGRKP